MDEHIINKKELNSFEKSIETLIEHELGDLANNKHITEGLTRLHCCLILKNMCKACCKDTKDN